MNIRAIIFDLYGTLLEVGPPPPDADARWQSLCRDMLHLEPPFSRLNFSIAASKVWTTPASGWPGCSTTPRN